MTTVMEKKEYLPDEKKVTGRLLRLIGIDSPSGNERNIADELIKELSAIGLEVYEDNSGAAFGGNAGNIIGFLRGNVKGKPLLLSAHMDTVVSNQNVRPIVERGLVRSDGRTILGGDDKAGIAIILEALEMIRDKQLPHGDIYIVFTAAEETGLLGAKNLDISQIKAEMAYVLDSGGPAGNVVSSAPAEVQLIVKIYGKAAHSGVNPEDGINAVQVAGQLLAKLKLGRLDNETTANIGLIKGGSAVSIVPEYVELQGEIKSANKEKIEKQVRRLEMLLEEVCYQARARFDIERKMAYQGYKLSEHEPVVQNALLAAAKLGLQGKTVFRGGGSDANIFNRRGIPCVNLGLGTQQVHTVHEYIDIREMLNTVRLLLGIVENALS